jgi:UDP-glucose 4-epimerase
MSETATSRSTHVKSVLVLGGGGFIGASLRERLAHTGAAVAVVSRSAAVGLHANETWSTLDIRDTAAVARLLRPGQDVYHLVSDSNPSSSNWDVEVDIRDVVLPTTALIKAAVTAGVRKIVYVSSGGTVYGVPRSVPLNETAATDPISGYGVGKLSVEKYLAVFGQLHGLNYQIARVANPFGPRQRPNRGQGVVATLMYQALTGAPFQIWGDGSVARDFVAVDDVAAALVAMCDYEGPHRIMNVGSGQARSIASVARDIETVLGLEAHPVLRRESRGFDVPVNYLDIGRITSETPWRPRTEWMDGLAATAEWMRQAIRQGDV